MSLAVVFFVAWSVMVAAACRLADRDDRAKVEQSCHEKGASGIPAGGVTASTTSGALASPPRPRRSAHSRGTTRRCLAGSANTKRL